MDCRLASIALFALSLMPTAALAQADELASPVPHEPAPVVDTSPGARVDIVLPGVGIGLTSTDSGAAYHVSAGVTVMDRSGHGVRVVAGGFDTSPSFSILGPSSAGASGLSIDASYAYRFRLVGNDRVGLGLDVYGGLTAAHMAFSQPSNGWCWSDCASPPHVDETVADGWHLGANAGASLDLRASVFIIGLDVRARTLFALQRSDSGDQVAQADLSATLYIGFGFY